MGTRSIVRVFDGKQEICTIYRHWDGYPSAMGKDLKRILGGKRVVNGLSGAPDEINRAGSVAASVVVGLADHSPEILPTGMGNCGQHYEYHVICPDLSGVPHFQAGPRGFPIELKCFRCLREALQLSELAEVDVDPVAGEEA